MSRVLVVGPKDQMDGAIEALHRSQLVHIVDHRGDDGVFSIGKPLPRASAVSEDLVRLRSIASVLKVEEGGPGEAATVEDVHGRITALALQLREEDESRKKAAGLVADLDIRIEAMRVFAALPLPLDAYRGYESLAVLVGRVSEEVRGLEAITKDLGAFTADGVVAAFVPKDFESRAREVLTRFGFAQVDVPEGGGDPRDALSRMISDRDKWTDRLGQIEGRIAKLRERYVGFIRATEARLGVEIEKAEAPLRFAVSDHSFVVDGWVPSDRVGPMTAALAALPGVLVEATDLKELHEAAGDEEVEPPVLLRNRGPARRFEFLTRLYSTPRYSELDPTSFLFILFPIFFGLMIGDAGYGLVMIVLGFALSAKLRNSPDFADLMRVVLYGGFFAYIFGMVLYGEIFGIPFHPPPSAPDEVSWTAILQYDIPYAAPIHKLEDVGVIDLLLLSVVASSIHLGLGYVVGFVNEVKHNRRHAIAKIGWLLILIGFLSFFVVLGRTPEWCAAQPWNEGCQVAGNRVVNRIFFDQPPLAWIPADGMIIGGLAIPWLMVGGILGGVVLLIVGEPMGALEIISLLSNMMSYTRLAGVAVAKGAVALAFNTMFLPLIINEEVFHATHVVQWNPSILFILLGFVLIFLAHAMVLILGAMSAGVQAIRLNYVEFFLKFYRGGGTLFSPFGARKPTTEA